MTNWEEIDDLVFRQGKRVETKHPNFLVLSLNKVFSSRTVSNETIQRYDWLINHHYLLPQESKEARYFDVPSLIVIANTDTRHIIHLKVGSAIYRLSPLEVQSNEIWTFEKLEPNKWRWFINANLDGEVQPIAMILPLASSIIVNAYPLTSFSDLPICPEGSDKFYKGTICNLRLYGRVVNVQQLLHNIPDATVAQEVNTYLMEWLSFNWPKPTDQESMIVYRNCVRNILHYGFFIDYDWEEGNFHVHRQKFDEIMGKCAIYGPTALLPFFVSIGQYLGYVYPSFIKKLNAILGSSLARPVKGLKFDKMRANLERICPELDVYKLTDMMNNEQLLFKFAMCAFCFPQFNSWQFMYLADVQLDTNILTSQDLSTMLISKAFDPSDALPVIITMKISKRSDENRGRAGRETNHYRTVICFGSNTSTFYNPSQEHQELFNVLIKRELALSFSRNQHPACDPEAFENQTPFGKLPTNITGIPYCIYLGTQRSEVNGKNLRFPVEAIVREEQTLKGAAVQLIRLYQQAVMRELWPHFSATAAVLPHDK
jgi:hypothetical protein